MRGSQNKARSVGAVLIAIAIRGLAVVALSVATTVAVSWWCVWHPGALLQTGDSTPTPDGMVSGCELRGADVCSVTLFNTSGSLEERAIAAFHFATTEKWRGAQSSIDIHVRRDDYWDIIIAGWPRRALWHGESSSQSFGGVEVPRWLPGPTPRARCLPARVLWSGMIINSALVAPVWIVVVFGPGMIRRWRRFRRGGCIRCGYDLKGLTGSVCPECGATAKGALG